MTHKAHKLALRRLLVTILLLALLVIGIGYIYMADQLSIETLGQLSVGLY